jgi:undecaprenyl-diphosphatase
VVSLKEAIIAGILQGILEWLPISSEGNLVIFLNGLLGLEATDTLLFVIFLHLGTGLSALFYFRREIISIILARNRETRLTLYRLILITLVTGIIGFPIFYFLSVSPYFGETLLGITGLALIFTGLIQKNRGSKGYKQLQELNWSETIGLGIVQGIAIIPGFSRSGATTSFLLFRDFKGEDAIRFSFLMSIPASFAAVFGMLLIDNYTISTEAVISLLSTIIVGYFTIDLLIKVAGKISFWQICLVLGIISIFAFLPSLAKLTIT